MLRRINLVFLLLFSLSAWAAGVSGLNYTAYVGGGASPSYTQNADGTLVRTYLSSGTVSTVNYNWSGGNVLNSNRGDGVIVRFYGYINIATSGTYQFGGNADDGIRIKVNNTSVVNSWIESGGTFRSGSIYLAAGTYPIELMYYENAGGAMVNLQWVINSSWQIIPSTSLATDSTYFTPVIVNPTTTGTSTGITTAQQTRKNNLITNRNSISGNSVYIDQAGDNNTVNITQSSSNNSIQGINQQNALLKGNSNTITVKQGNSSDPTGKNLIKLEMNTGSNSNQIKLYQGYNADGSMNIYDSDGHIISLGLTGSSNQINLYQTNLGANNAGNFAELNITGSTNNITVNQKGSGSKTLFTSVTGNNNTVSALQDGLGQQYLDITLTGNGHTVNASQDGTGNHLGYINLTNGGGASTVNLTQSGSTAQSYSITQTCVNPAGCSVSVTQP
jgi:hypothetical protein